MSKRVVLVPVFDSIDPRCERGLQQLSKSGWDVRRARGHSQIDFARSLLATQALGDGFEEIMWIDSDIIFDPKDVDRVSKHGKDLICGIYAKKSRRALACQTLNDTAEIRFGEFGGLIEIKYAATGFLYTRRKMYLDIREKLNLPLCNKRFGSPVVPFFHPILLPEPNEDYWYLGEDFSFCERARLAGYKCWADTAIRLWHVGSYAFGWEDAGSELTRFADYRFDISDGG